MMLTSEERGGLFVAENLWEKSEIMQLKQTFTLQPINCSEGMNVKVQKAILKKVIAQRGARTHDPEIKSLMLYRLS